MGTAQLPTRQGESKLEGRELNSFLKEHDLAISGPPDTLPMRAWKLQQAIRTNPALLP